MAYTTTGKKHFVALSLLFFVNVVVLALSAKVNQFQEYFFVADLFPLALSIITFVVLFAMLLLDLSLDNSFAGRPPFEIGFMSVFTILWLAFNSFSSSRWHDVPLQCDTIPSDFTDEIGWCKDLQALKAFVWVEFLMFFFITLSIVRFSLIQHFKGNHHVWSTSLSRYSAETGFTFGDYDRRFEKF